MKCSTDSNHLSQDLIIRMLDDELTPTARQDCEIHLAVCEGCRHEWASLQNFSTEIDAAVHSATVPDMDNLRRDIEKQIEASSVTSLVLQHPGQIMRRFGWGMGIAATLAFAILMAPRHSLNPESDVGRTSGIAASQQATAIEVDGETFLPVPYSNADLSTAAPHIVQMQVPVSSLADIGIEFESVTNRAGSGPEAGSSVLADVLVGADGQPRGVHVLGLE